MKLIRIAEPGKVMNQPKGKPSSGKMDSQIFLEKEDPSHAAKKKRKKKGKEKKRNVSDAGKCSVCTAKKKSTEEAEKFEYNPWAVCTESVGREDEESYESCVQQVKKKERKKLKDK